MSFADMRRAYQLKCLQEAERYISEAQSSSKQVSHKIQISTSPLMAALFKGHSEVVRLLIEAGAVWGELSPWCDQAVQDEPRLEPVLRSMMSMAMFFDDFTQFGPFGVKDCPVNSVDVGVIPSQGTVHGIIAQFSPTDRSLSALQFLHFVDGKPYPCHVHHTTLPGAGDFESLDSFSHVERLMLEPNEYVTSAEIGVCSDHVSSLRFTTNYRACKWLGPDPTLSGGTRIVTVAPNGREIVGIFASVEDRFNTIGFLTRLRMGDFPWRTLRNQLPDEDDQSASS